MFTDNYLNQTIYFMKKKFAVIDIGSNAIRFEISAFVAENGTPIFKRHEYIRFPLRLGQDVFSISRISEEKEEKFLRLIQVFKDLMGLYEVEAHIACATSAMRESENGKLIVSRVAKEIGIDIEVIDGDREAYLINKGIERFIDKRKNMIHIDVGGGSTEINIYSKGIKTAAHSFQLGTVRSLKGKSKQKETEHLKNWIQENTAKLKGVFCAIGTGGNINKMSELVIQKTKIATISLKELKNIYQVLNQLNLRDRILHYNFHEDRADVIVPAAQIYITAMEAAQAQKITVPKVGLREGMLYALYEEHL